MCGSRDWDDPEIVRAVLNGLAWANCTLVVIEGGATGADRAAKEWAMQEGVNDDVEPPDGVWLDSYAADWGKQGKAAGPIRNQVMLDEGKPDAVLAFSDQPLTRGTADMVKRAKKAGVPVYVVNRP